MSKNPLNYGTHNTTLYTEKTKHLLVLTDTATRRVLASVRSMIATLYTEDLNILWAEAIIRAHLRRTWVELSYTEMVHKVQEAEEHKND